MSISGEIYNLLENYLSSRFQRVFLNGQTSSLRPILVGGRQGSILGPLLFLININDLNNELKLNSLLMTHLFLLLLRIRMKVLMFSTNLQSFSTWVYNWKMLFNSDSSKLAQEVVFFIKKKIQLHLTISLNNVQVERVSYHKHLGILLDEKLNFKQQIDNAISKVNKVFGNNKLRHNLPRKSLITIYKPSLRPLTDYGDTIYDHHKMNLFVKK